MEEVLKRLEATLSVVGQRIAAIEARFQTDDAMTDATSASFQLPPTTEEESSTDSTDFEEQRRRKRPLRSLDVLPETVPTVNPFDALGNEEPMEGEEAPTSETTPAGHNERQVKKRKKKQRKPRKQPLPPSTNTTPTRAPRTPEPPALDNPAPTTITTVSAIKVPPVVIRETARWNTLSNAFTANCINYSKARTTFDGIRVQPTTETDFRKLTRFLEDERVPYHTYTLSSERTVKVVIRGLPVDMEVDHIKCDLERQGLVFDKITRMTSLRTKRPMPLYFLEAPTGTTINVSNLCGLAVKIEPPRAKKGVEQCHRCQGFFHSAKNCKAPPRCVICAEEHLTAACPRKGTDQPPSCTNCIAAGKEASVSAHTANYRGCQCFPRKRKPDTKSPSSAPGSGPASASSSAAAGPSRPKKGKGPRPNSSSAVTDPLSHSLVINLIQQVSKAKGPAEALAAVVAFVPQIWAEFAEGRSN